MADILVVDDDETMATAFRQFLAFEGHDCRIASDAAEAGRMIAATRPDLVLMDIRMPGTNGLDALEQFRADFPGLCIVMMTAYSTSANSIAAIRAGAFDYLMKPLDLEDLRTVIDKALASQRASQSFDASPEPVTAGLVGNHPAMLEVYKVIGRLATNRVPTLIVGERGTGKRLVVATIHDQSAGHDQPLVAVDCATITGEALSARLAEAGGGTIELRHVDRLPAPLQARIVDALASDRTRPAAQRLSARLLATAEKDPAEAVESGTFSRELYDELSVITIRLPPLRERRSDIPALVQHFLLLCAGELGRTLRGVDGSVMELLVAHTWAGNVRELEQTIRRAAIVARGDVITDDEIGNSLREAPEVSQDISSAVGRSVRDALRDRLSQSERAGSAYHDIVEMAETALVAEALAITHGNQVKAAEILGVNRATLRKKMPAD